VLKTARNYIVHWTDCTSNVLCNKSKMTYCTSKWVFCIMYHSVQWNLWQIMFDYNFI